MTCHCCKTRQPHEQGLCIECLSWVKGIASSDLRDARERELREHRRNTRRFVCNECGCMRRGETVLRHVTGFCEECKAWGGGVVVVWP